MEIESILERIGLTRQEAIMYLNTLKLGMAKASEIAQKSNVKREGSYYTLKLLIEKGYISEIIKSGVKYYSAVSPKRILEIIEEEKQQKTDLIKDIIPELESSQKIAIITPKIELFEGPEGLKTAASIMVQKGSQVIYCYVPEKILHFVPSFHPQFRRRRREKKVFLKVITEETPDMIKLQETDKAELRETRFSNAIISGRDSGYYILNDGIIILKANEKEQLGIYIQDKNIAELQGKIFEEIWKIAKH